MTSGNSIELLDRWRNGEEDAARALFEIYTSRLIALVRSHLSEKYARRLDPDDVVQSAYRSFFVGTRNGRYLIQRSGDLWRVLVAIALHKLHHQVDRHSAVKRSVNRESYFADENQIVADFSSYLTRAPSVDEALSASDQIETMLLELEPVEQRIFELRLEGYTLDEIASDVDRSQRTVRRTMVRIKDCLIDRFPDSFPAA